jgi:hypothetical protein
MTSDAAKRAIGYAGLAGVALHWLCEHPQFADRLGVQTGGPGNDLLAVCLIGMILLPILRLPSGRAEIDSLDLAQPAKGEGGSTR